MHSHMNDITVSPQCFAAGGTNRGDSQCKRGRIKTQGSATDSTRYHVCLTQIIGGNEVISILLATQLFISYVNILDYTFDMLPMLEERDVTCLRPVPFFLR